MKLITLLFISTFNIATLASPIDLSSPRMTMKSFLKSMKKYKLGDDEYLIRATKTFDLSHLDDVTKLPTAELAAKRLINSLDRIEYIDIKKIPLKPNSDKWTYLKKFINLDGEDYEVEISISKNKNNEWKFTKKTLATVEYLEKSLLKKNVVKGVVQLKSWKDSIKAYMPDWTGKRSFVLLNGQWLAILFLIFISLLIERLFRLYLISKISKLAQKRSIDFENNYENKFKVPVGLFTFSGIWLIGIKAIELSDDVYAITYRIGVVCFTFACVLCAYNIVDLICMFLQKKASESENKFDDILVPLVRKSAKTLVVLIGIVFIGDSLTLDMKSLLAGLGIGGLAFALAAKDTISNIFGSLTVLLDRPFRIGDWVTINDKIDGTVEEVGLRSTRIRTFYDSLITLPNGLLTNAHIDNYGQRKFRRFSTKIGIQYDTSAEKIEAFCEGIRQIILKHKWTRKDNFHVYLNGLGSSSLDILLYVFWSVPDWSSELQEKHRLLIDIIRLGKKLEVEFAFPTQTLHVFNEEKIQGNISIKKEEAHNFGAVLAEEITNSPSTTPIHRSGSNVRNNPDTKLSL